MTKLKNCKDTAMYQIFGLNNVDILPLKLLELLLPLMEDHMSEVFDSSEVNVSNESGFELLDSIPSPSEGDDE